VCYSAEASLATGILLLPVGTYCVLAAFRKNIGYLPLAATPLLFGIQQVCEAGVWVGLQRNDPSLVKASAIAFLFFALAFWPGWMPLTAAGVEFRSRTRRWPLVVAGVVGLTLGGARYIAAVIHYDEWLVVEIAVHSIRYDLSKVPPTDAVASVVWQGLYLALVSLPLVVSHERRLRPIGILVAASAVVAILAFRYAFGSVWCFFAALLSFFISYVLYRLPPAPTSRGDAT